MVITNESISESATLINEIENDPAWAVSNPAHLYARSCRAVLQVLADDKLYDDDPTRYTDVTTRLGQTESRIAVIMADPSLSEAEKINLMKDEMESLQNSRYPGTNTYIFSTDKNIGKPVYESGSENKATGYVVNISELTEVLDDNAKEMAEALRKGDTEKVEQLKLSRQMIMHALYLDKMNGAVLSSAINLTNMALTSSKIYSDIFSTLDYADAYTKTIERLRDTKGTRVRRDGVDNKSFYVDETQALKAYNERINDIRWEISKLGVERDELNTKLNDVHGDYYDGFDFSQNPGESDTEYIDRLEKSYPDLPTYAFNKRAMLIAEKKAVIAENELKAKLKDVKDADGNRVYSDTEIDEIVNKIYTTTNKSCREVERELRARQKELDESKKLSESLKTKRPDLDGKSDADINKVIGDNGTKIIDITKQINDVDNEIADLEKKIKDAKSKDKSADTSALEQELSKKRADRQQLDADRKTLQSENDYLNKVVTARKAIPRLEDEIDALKNVKEEVVNYVDAIVESKDASERYRRIKVLRDRDELRLKEIGDGKTSGELYVLNEELKKAEIERQNMHEHIDRYLDWISDDRQMKYLLELDTDDERVINFRKRISDRIKRGGKNRAPGEPLTREELMEEMNRPCGKPAQSIIQVITSEEYIDAHETDPKRNKEIKDSTKIINDSHIDTLTQIDATYSVGSPGSPGLTRADMRSRYIGYDSVIHIYSQVLANDYAFIIQANLTSAFISKQEFDQIQADYRAWQKANPGKEPPESYLYMVASYKSYKGNVDRYNKLREAKEKQFNTAINDAIQKDFTSDKSKSLDHAMTKEEIDAMYVKPIVDEMLAHGIGFADELELRKEIEDRVYKVITGELLPEKHDAFVNSIIKEAIERDEHGSLTHPDSRASYLLAQDKMLRTNLIINSEIEKIIDKYGVGTPEVVRAQNNYYDSIINAQYMQAVKFVDDINNHRINPTPAQLEELKKIFAYDDKSGKFIESKNPDGTVSYAVRDDLELYEDRDATCRQFIQCVEVCKAEGKINRVREIDDQIRTLNGIAKKTEADKAKLKELKQERKDILADMKEEYNAEKEEKANVYEAKPLVTFWTSDKAKAKYYENLLKSINEFLASDITIPDVDAEKTKAEIIKARDAALSEEEKTKVKATANRLMFKLEQEQVKQSIALIDKEYPGIEGLTKKQLAEAQKEHPNESDLPDYMKGKSLEERQRILKTYERRQKLSGMDKKLTAINADPKDPSSEYNKESKHKENAKIHLREELEKSLGRKLKPAEMASLDTTPCDIDKLLNDIKPPLSDSKKIEIKRDIKDVREAYDNIPSAQGQEYEREVFGVYNIELGCITNATADASIADTAIGLDGTTQAQYVDLVQELKDAGIDVEAGVSSPDDIETMINSVTNPVAQARLKRKLKILKDSMKVNPENAIEKEATTPVVEEQADKKPRELDSVDKPLAVNEEDVATL